MGERLGNAHHHHHRYWQQRGTGRGRKATKGIVYRLTWKCFPSEKRCWHTEKHTDFIQGKGRDANLKNQTDIFHIPYYKHEAISTSVLLRWDFSYIFYAKILLKAGLLIRQEKTYHLLGSLKSTLLTLIKYSQQACPIAPCEEANPSLPFPRQAFRAQSNTAQTFHSCSPTIYSRS